MDTDINKEEIELIKSLETNPEAFIELILERKLSPKQKEFLDATSKHNHIVAIWSRQTGKSTVIASYIIWRLLYGKGTSEIKEQIAIVAPIKEQLINLYDKIKSLVDKNEIISKFVVKLNSERIVMMNGNKANFFSGSPGSHIRGYTATCIVIDESQDITDHKYSADILPFGATTNALVLEAGTPKTKNHFFEIINSKEVKVIKQPWYECPFLSEEYVMQQRNISPEALWRQEYLCEFIEEGVLAFPSWLFEPKKMPDGEVKWNIAEYNFLSEITDLTKEVKEKITELVKEGATFVSGLDLGKQNDNSVYTIYRTDIRPIRLYLKIKYPLKTSYKEIARQIGHIHKFFSPYEFNVDYSNEKGFIEMLLENDVPITVEPRKTSGQRHIKGKRGAIAFTNKNKAEMITSARVLLEKYQLQLPKSDEGLISEFLNQQYEVTENNIYKYYHPSNQNDDSLWSTLLALKNVITVYSEEKVSFMNPWEKHDEKIASDYNSKRKEVLVATSKLRRTYEPAEFRRRNTEVRHRY